MAITLTQVRHKVCRNLAAFQESFNCKTDPEHFQPLSSQCDMHVKLPHQATFALPEACFPAPMGSKSPIKYKEWMKALLRPHLTKIENDQKIRKTFLKNLIVVDFSFGPLVKVIILPVSLPHQNRCKRDRFSSRDVVGSVLGLS